ncbi:MAG: hypothetical protein V4576_02645 [Patescibacteria group bacterium]
MENPTAYQIENQESKRQFLGNMENARQTCMVIYDKMMTGDMSTKKAQEILDETFIDSGLLEMINDSDVSSELKARIKQILNDPYAILNLSNTYRLADTSLENLFEGALGLIEGESNEWQIEDEYKKEISSIMDKVNKITHNEVVDIKFKNYFIGHAPGSTGKNITKQGGVWKRISTGEDGIQIDENVDMNSYEKSDTQQIKLHEETIIDEIRETILDIKLFLKMRSKNLPARVVEVLADLREELEKTISSSLDEVNPSLMDYTGTDFEGRFAYTGLVAKEFRYRNLLRGKLK